MTSLPPRKTRVSYTLPSPRDSTRHIGGLNALAVDFVSSSALLYSGGRDARVHAWDTNTDLVALREAEDVFDFGRGETRDEDEATPGETGSQAKAAYNIGRRLSTKFSTRQSHVAIPPTSSEEVDDPRIRPKPLRSVSFGESDSNNPSSNYPESSAFPSYPQHTSIVNEYPNSTSNSNSNNQLHHSRGSSMDPLASIVTCSNDRMVYLWSTTQTNMYMRLGYHTDHVKCLAYSSNAGWVASGGLDRRVMIWDTMEGRDKEIVGFSVSSSVFCHDKSPKASIYALACNPAGTVIVSGSPDKIVRVWDPRSGKEAIGLTGHRDNIRGLLVSDDGKWVISASSDTTIKLWSLAHPQRCMVTYTHYEDSVWCLYSNHPDLDTFWAGGRDGLVTKMSRRRIGGGNAPSTVGGAGAVGGGSGTLERAGSGLRMDDELVDCVAICKEDGPVNKLVAVDDMFVWTATDKPSINRWRDVPFRQAVVVPTRDLIPPDSDRVYIPAASIIQQDRTVLGAATIHSRFDTTLGISGTIGVGSFNETTAAMGGPMGTDLSRSGSLVSKDAYSFNPPSKFSSSMAANTTRRRQLFSGSFVDMHLSDSDDEDDIPVEPVWLTPDFVIEGGTSGIVRFLLLNDRMHVVTEESGGGVSLWDIVRCVKVKDFEVEPGPGAFKKCCEEVNTFEWVANWCTIDTKNGFLTIHLDESKFYEAEVYYESVVDVPPAEDQRVNIGKWVLSYLFICYMHVTRQQIPPAAVMYHDHYLGAVTYTQIGCPPDSTSHYLFGQSVYYGPPDLIFLDPAVPIQTLIDAQKSGMDGGRVGQQQQNGSARTESPGSERRPRMESLGKGIVGAVAGMVGSQEEEEQVVDGVPVAKVSVAVLPASLTLGAMPNGAGDVGEVGVKEVEVATAPAVVRLRPRPLVQSQRPESMIQVESALTHVQQIVKQPIAYSPNTEELPMIRIPPDVSILVSCEESPEAACYLDQFRSTVGQIGWVREAMRLDECIPRWVLDAITDKKLKDAPKMSFTMSPHLNSDLPDLPNNSNRLSSNRMIRLRKLLAYVAEQAKISPPLSLVKAALLVQQQQLQQQQNDGRLGVLNSEQQRPATWMGLVNPGSVEALTSALGAQHPTPPLQASQTPLNDTGSTRSGMSAMFGRTRKRTNTAGGSSVTSEANTESLFVSDEIMRELVKPEEYLELWCQDKVLDPKMTLGTVRNMIWKSGAGDL
ncbi:hypothetical protein HDU98_010509, partial [Podochytrium sp. JEL0797]